jgi:hypothetical protein
MICSEEKRMPSDFDFDVVVIGAGFAGLTAARECSNRGLSTLVLEGSERIGGRTCTTRWSTGEPMDVGGTFVHWTQPHLWSEVSRYGLEDQIIEAGEEIDEIQIPVPGGARVMPYSEWAPVESRLGNAFFEPSQRVFPRPHQPMLMRSEVEKWDISVEDRIQQLDITDEEAYYLRALYALDGSGDVSSVSFLQLLRWYALAGHDYDQMAGLLYGNRFKDGTVTLANAIKDDSRAEVRLKTAVGAVEADATSVTVTTDGGDFITARACIFATPSGTWGDIKTSPGLSAEKLSVAQDKRLQAPASANIKVRLTGVARRFFILGHPTDALAHFYTYRMEADGSQIAQIWPNPHFNTTDTDRIVAEIKAVLPEAEVAEVIGEAWTPQHRFARGGYPMFHPGVLSADVPHEQLAQPEGRLFFATADISTFWNSFIDGAIQSGLRAAREVREVIGRTAP